MEDALQSLESITASPKVLKARRDGREDHHARARRYVPDAARRSDTTAPTSTGDLRREPQDLELQLSRQKKRKVAGYPFNEPQEPADQRCAADRGSGTGSPARLTSGRKLPRATFSFVTDRPLCRRIRKLAGVRQTSASAALTRAASTAAIAASGFSTSMISLA